MSTMAADCVSIIFTHWPLVMWMVEMILDALGLNLTQLVYIFQAFLLSSNLLYLKVGPIPGRIMQLKQSFFSQALD